MAPQPYAWRKGYLITFWTLQMLCGVTLIAWTIFALATGTEYAPTIPDPTTTQEYYEYEYMLLRQWVTMYV